MAARKPLKRLDETVPGGKYLAADGKTLVDAWGKPIEKPAPPEENEGGSGENDGKDSA